MTSEARVVALDRVRPGNVGRRSGDLLDVVFGCLVCDHEGPAAPREPAPRPAAGCGSPRSSPTS